MSPSSNQAADVQTLENFPQFSCTKRDTGLIQTMEAALQQSAHLNHTATQWLSSKPTTPALERTSFRGKNARDTAMLAQPAQELETQIMQSIHQTPLQNPPNLQIHPGSTVQKVQVIPAHADMKDTANLT